MDSVKAIKRKFTMIIVGLLSLFIINIFYLAGLYNAIAKETAKLVLQSIEESDNEEIQHRLNVLSSLSDESTQTISIEKSGKDIEAGMIAFSRLIKEVKLKIHQSIDSLMPVNIPVLDSLIVSNFKKKGISARLFYSEIVDLNSGTVIASSHAAAAQMQDNFYLYEYDTENRHAYKIYTASMTVSVLKRMSGILATTFLTIVLLAYAFVYFIRTVVRQKTLEEMKRDFTNNMTHELNTPISVAYSAVDTLLNFKQGESREKSRQYLNICIEQLSHLRDLVEHILSMSMDRSKNITVNKALIELKPLLMQIVSQQKLKTEKCVDTVIIVLPENLTVYADKTHFSNIINNLIDNAIKYSLVHVKIEIKAYFDEKYSIISIKDNGIGINKENQKHIFDRFYRVPYGNLHNVKGYGLGLFYVKTMIEQHDGEITVKSAINKGSEFIIKIPVK
ncbi:MAG: HAMP domain-containing histidine kinase [Candidatus Symbiothrix sp.]|jgi:signal transduction histidine kinase|nr:HAMP domain-containing histidine kinase [Candidatus Symbiothrix sp.]